MKTIRVEGKGTFSQPPDMIKLTFGVNEVSKDFSQAVEGCNSRVAMLKSAASKCNIDPSALKTVNFNVEEETEYKNDRRCRAGFRAGHYVLLLLKYEREAVGRFLSEVMSGTARPQVKIAFKTSDAEAIKRKVLEAAVENATQRAQIIANSSGVKLGQIVNIEHGNAHLKVSTTACDFFLASETPELCTGPDFEPDNIKVTDSVMVAWEIVQ